MGSDDIIIVEALVEDQTIAYAATHPQATYDDYVRLLSWYWALPAKLKSSWVPEWIRCLTGEGTNAYSS